MNVGDDVIIAGKIIAILPDNLIAIDLPNGEFCAVHAENIKSYRPEVKTDGEDHRKGN